jgi:gamma-glutamyltranspeptidase/glutathione hydrolase
MKNKTLSLVLSVLGGLLVVSSAIRPALPVSAASPQPVRARHGMVVSVEEHASQVGMETLRRGGNAVDAAIAVGLALAVTHPTAGNLGGGGFMLIRFKDGRATFIDFRERAPAAASRNMYLDANGNQTGDSWLKVENPDTGRETTLMVGPRASGIPGSVAGFEYARAKYGSMKWADLVEPAEKMAADGFVLDYDTSRSLSSAGTKRLLERYPDSKTTFLKEGGYQWGDVFVQKNLAATLDILRKKGPRDFYEGDIAKRLDAFMKANNGTITLDDLRNYKVKERDVLRGTYKGYEIVTAPPPSSGGVAMIEMLNILEGVPLKESGFGSAKALHWVTEAMRRAFADRAEFMGDPDFNKLPVHGLTDKKYAAGLRATIDADHASTSQMVRAGNPAPYESMETTHYSVVDKDGTAVAVTYTLNGGYGSGVTAGDLGFLLNNEMDDFTAKPGAPNAYGILQSEANTIEPGKTPLSSMTPTVVTKDGALVLVLGSPGGPTIINTVFNTVLNFLEFGMNVQAAVDAPRIHHQWMPDRLQMENGFSPDTIELLKARGHNLSVGASIGDCDAIAVDPRSGDLLGAADSRHGGKAVGY